MGGGRGTTVGEPQRRRDGAPATAAGYLASAKGLGAAEGPSAKAKEER